LRSESLMVTAPLPVGLFRFDLTVTEDVALPPYKGFAFRGVFGTVLRELACVMPGEQCQRCPFRHTCTYAYLFETSPAQGVDGFRRFSNFPRPYILHPPMGDKRLFRRYDTMSFAFVLIGRASQCLPQVITTFEEIGRRGIRNGSGRYMIDSVTAIGDEGLARVIYRKGVRNGTALPLKAISLQQSESQTITDVTLEFTTPLLLEERGKIQFEPPRFSLLFEHLARRIMLLQAVHGPGCVEIEQLDSLMECTSAVETKATDMRWQSMERISNRQQARIKTGGLVGSITFSGDLTPFVPYLQAGELLHVGKSTTFGFGAYKLTPE